MLHRVTAIFRNNFNKYSYIFHHSIIRYTQNWIGTEKRHQINQSHETHIQLKISSMQMNPQHQPYLTLIACQVTLITFLNHHFLLSHISCIISDLNATVHDLDCNKVPSMNVFHKCFCLSLQPNTPWHISFVTVALLF